MKLKREVKDFCGFSRHIFIVSFTHAANLLSPANEHNLISVWRGVKITFLILLNFIIIINKGIIVLTGGAKKADKEVVGTPCSSTSFSHNFASE